MLAVLWAFVAFTSLALADRAITSPVNGSTVVPGQQISFNWYSDDDDDGRQFDVALMSLRQLGEYQVTDRQVSEVITIPADMALGTHYLGIIELDSDSDNDLDERSLDEYKLRLNINGQDGARPIAVEVTAAGNTRRSRLAVRQNNGDDGTLYSPSETSSIAAGSSFNFTYRCEDSDTRIVLVGLVRAYTGLQGSTVPTLTSEMSSFAGQITIPDNLADGNYYLAVYADNNDAPQIGEYDLTFSTNAQLRGNDVDITGPERPFIVNVGGNSPSSATASSTPSPTISGGVASVLPSTATTSLPATVSISPAPSNAAIAPAKVPTLGGLIGGLVVWAMI